MFHVGQLVICINDNFEIRYPVCGYPIRNGIYTIRALVVTPWGPGLHLYEIQNPQMFFKYDIFDELAFKEKRFRPVAKKTDISVFTKLLAPLQFENSFD
jgi:hypothetical protein